MILTSLGCPGRAALSSEIIKEFPQLQWHTRCSYSGRYEELGNFIFDCLDRRGSGRDVRLERARSHEPYPTGSTVFNSSSMTVREQRQS